VAAVVVLARQWHSSSWD